MASKVFVRVVLWLPLMFSLDGAAVPVFVVEPEDTVATPVAIGQFRSATLHCQTSFQDTVSVTWYKDDVAIEMASLPSYNITNSSLVVTTTESQDDGMILEGFYYCVVSNHFGAARSRSALVKTQRLVASFQPKDTTVFYRSETVVVAEIGYLQQPVPNSRTLWLVECGGKQFSCTTVNCALWHHVSTAGRLLVYSILRLTHNDIKVAIPDCLTKTTVSVTGSSGYGPPFMYQATFEGLTFTPKRTLFDEQEMSVEIGTNTTLYCISNHPNGTYTWDQNGSLIMVADDSRFSVIIDGVLQIRNVLERDGGQYDCSSTASYPDVPNPATRHTIINLSVYSVPSVNMTLIQNDPRRTVCGTITSASMCTVHPNVSSVAVLCDYDGSGPLLVQILHNASVLFQLNVTDDQRSVQQNISIPSSGVYQCIATNPYGSKQISLYVLTPGPTSTVPTAAPSTSTPTTPSRLPTPLSTKAPRSTTQNQSVPASTPTAAARLPTHLSTTAPHSTAQNQSVPASTSTSVAASTPTSSTGDTPFPTRAFSTVSVSTSPPTATSVQSLRTASSSIASSPLSTNASSSTTTGTTTTTTTPLGGAGSQTSSDVDVAAVAGGAASGIIVLCLLVIMIVVICRYRQKRGLHTKVSATVRSSTVYENPSFDNAVVDGEDPRYKESGGQEKPPFYETLNKPTAVVQPVKRQTENKEDESDRVNPYDVLNRETDELPITTFNKPAEGYAVLNDFRRQTSNQSDPPVSRNPSDGEYSSASADGHPICPSIGSSALLGDTNMRQTKQSSLETTDDDENPYAVPVDKKPKRAASAGRSVSPSEGEYSYSTPNVKRLVSTSPDHAAMGGNEYSPSEKQVKRRPSTGAYEEVVIGTSHPRCDHAEEDSVYAVAVEEKKNDGDETAVPPETEYSYARPDVKRPWAISFDRVVVGAAATALREDDEPRRRVGGEEEDPYMVPGEDKPTRPLNRRPTLPPPNAVKLYAAPDVKKPVAVPERVTVGEDEYAVSTKQTGSFRSGIEAKPEAARCSSYPSEPYTADEDQYAVPTEPSKQNASNRSDIQPPAAVPEHFTVGTNEYAVTTKGSVKQTRDSDRGTNLRPEHCQTGENQYAVSAKVTSPSRYSKKGKDSGKSPSLASVGQPSKRSETSDGPYADVDDLEMKTQGVQ